MHPQIKGGNWPRGRTQTSKSKTNVMSRDFHRASYQSVMSTDANESNERGYQVMSAGIRKNRIVVSVDLCFKKGPFYRRRHVIALILIYLSSECF